MTLDKRKNLSIEVFQLINDEGMREREGKERREGKRERGREKKCMRLIEENIEAYLCDLIS